MGRFLQMIADLPIDSEIGQIVQKQLLVYRSLGVAKVDPEVVARDSYNVFLGNMQRQQMEIAELRSRGFRTAREISEAQKPTPTSELLNARCPDCGREVSFHPTAPQSGELDAQGRRNVALKCPGCGSTFKVTLKAAPAPTQTESAPAERVIKMTVPVKRPAAQPVKQPAAARSVARLMDSDRAGDLPEGFYRTEAEAMRDPWR